MFIIILKAALPAAAVFAVTTALVMAAGGGMLFWTPAGWMLAGLPALVVGGIVFEGSRKPER